MTAKTRAIPGLHRDKFLAKVQGQCPDAAPGNAYELYRRAVSVHFRVIPGQITPLGLAFSRQIYLTQNSSFQLGQNER